MSVGKKDKRKTKAELIEELNDLRSRVAELEAQETHRVEPPSGDGAAGISNGQTRGNGVTPSLGDLADTVMATLRGSVPEQVDVRLTVEERMGMIPTMPGIAEQIVVNLFLIRAEPTLHR